MKTIFKYALEIKDSQVIELPLEFKLLSVKEQNGQLCLWAVVDTDKPKTNATIAIIGIGNPIEECDSFFYDWEFIDTVIMSNGLVWHVFEDNSPF